MAKEKGKPITEGEIFHIIKKATTTELQREAAKEILQQINTNYILRKRLKKTS